MKTLSSWALKHLLPLLSETVSPLLPVKFKLSAEDGHLPLKFNGEKIAYLQFDPLPPEEELKKWQSLLLAYFEQTLYLLVKERFIKERPGPEFLKRELEKRKLTGFLLKLNKSVTLPEKVYALSTKIYFVPAEEIKPRSFLKSLWQEGIEFSAISCLLTSPDDVKQALETLLLSENFGFCWLTEKGEDYFPVSVIFEHRAFFKKLLKEANGHILVWAKGPRDSLNCLLKKAKGNLFLSENEAIFVLTESIDNLTTLLSSLSLRAGVRPPKKTSSPLKELWAAFEHAKRLPHEKPVVFEPYSLHVLGDVLLDMGDLFGALKCYLEAEAETPQPVELLNSLAYIYLELRDFEKSEKALRRAISISPKDPMLHYNLGLFLQKIGKNPLAALEKAYSLAPSEAIFAESLASHLTKDNSWAKVKDILENLAISNKGKLLLAKAYYELGELDKAFEMFRSLANEEPQNLEVLGYLALLYIQLKGEFEVAEAVISQLNTSDSLKSLAENIRFFLEARA
ncbi:Tetratricopeptide TPR_1 repeat-containing protein [Thermodesulfatator indicus DSM 15286]|uniref:Tetratricopeptide TPR_1 repeat-containing protein n=1 Tax=Thermodesulfatator indicus (strain DSM 15286 / JCM 11887 / CIR29812) TaxID=667014 RepID=F8AAM8_THEID|nr:tetratricopeptide repeat protein [Thermodesulfatator indicus]AEH44300.1 Tetratricopeptide TPR_1 repeat-containing protein [Thermodesulfatator indicus DSM 15286]